MSRVCVVASNPVVFADQDAGPSPQPVLGLHEEPASERSAHVCRPAQRHRAGATPLHGQPP